MTALDYQPKTAVGNVRWRMAALVSTAIAISYLDRNAFPAAYNALNKEFNFNNTDKAFLDSGFLVAYGLMYIGGGRLMDLLGTRIGMAIVMLFWTVACASHGLAFGFWSLLACRLALGLGEGGGFPGATRAVAEWFTVRERSTAMGIMNGGSAVGGVVANPLILILILPNIFWFGLASWRWGFLITGSFGLLWLIWWMLDYHKPESHRGVGAGELAHIQSGALATPENGPPITLAMLFSHKETWGLMLAKFLTDGAWYFYNFWLPKFLMDFKHLNYKETGSINWIPPAASGVGCLCGGFLSSYLLKKGHSVDRARKWALAASVVVMPLVMFVPALPVAWVIVVFALAFFGQQWWSTLIMIVPTDMYPRRALGTIAGLVGFAGAMGGIAMGQVAGYILDHSDKNTGYIPVMIIAGSLHVLGFAVILLAVRKIRPLDMTKPT